MEDILEECDHGRAIGIVVRESDLEAEDGIGIWAWQVHTGSAKRIGWYAAQGRLWRYLCARTTLPSTEEVPRAPALRKDPWDWHASNWRCVGELVSYLARAIDKPRRVPTTRRYSSKVRRWRNTYKSRHSFCRAKARERKGMICACCSARSGLKAAIEKHVDCYYHAAVWGGSEPAERVRYFLADERPVVSPVQIEAQRCKRLQKLNAELEGDLNIYQ